MSPPAVAVPPANRQTPRGPAFREERQLSFGPARGLFDGGPRAQLAVHVEDRRRVVPDQAELGDDLASGLLFLDLLGEEPLQLGDSRESLLLERGLVECVDLPADFLLLRERLLEYISEGLEFLPWLLERLEIDVGVAGKDEVEELQRVPGFAAEASAPRR